MHTWIQVVFTWIHLSVYLGSRCVLTLELTSIPVMKAPALFSYLRLVSWSREKTQQGVNMEGQVVQLEASGLGFPCRRTSASHLDKNTALKQHRELMEELCRRSSCTAVPLHKGPCSCPCTAFIQILMNLNEF